MNSFFTRSPYYCYVGIALLLFSISFLPASYPQSHPTLIDHDFEKKSLKEIGEVYDSPNTLRVATLINQKTISFSSLMETGLSFKPSISTYWIRTKLKNPDASQKSLLLVFRNPAIDEIKFYKVRDGNIVDSLLTGDSFTFQERKIKHRYFIYPIQLRPNEECEIYFSLFNNGAPVLVRGDLIDRNHFEEHDLQNSFWNIVILGFFLFCCLVSIIASIVFQKKIIIYFTIYCISASLLLLLTNGYGGMYLWPHWANLDKRGYLLFNAYFFGLIMMTKIYLDTRKNALILDSLLNILIKFLLLGSPVIIFYHLFTIDQLVVLYRFALPTILLFTLSVFITTLYIYWKTKLMSNLIFLIGFLFSLFAIMIFAIEHQGWADNIYSTTLSLVCLTIDFCLLMVLIGNRFYNMESEYHRLQSKATDNLLKGEKKARARISQNIHDEVLTDMKVFKSEINDSVAGDVKNALISDFTQIIDKIRSLMHDISPYNFEQEDFVLAIQLFIQKATKKNSWKVIFVHKNFDQQKLNAHQKEELLFVIKELFMNSINHSEGDRIYLSLENKSSFKLILGDNGKGFDIAQKNQGIGLEGINARAILLNGTFSIKSDAEGSLFEFTIP